MGLRRSGHKRERRIAQQCALPYSLYLRIKERAWQLDMGIPEMMRHALIWYFDEWDSTQQEPGGPECDACMPCPTHDSGRNRRESEIALGKK